MKELLGSASYRQVVGDGGGFVRRLSSGLLSLLAQRHRLSLLAVDADAFFSRMATQALRGVVARARGVPGLRARPSTRCENVASSFRCLGRPDRSGGCELRLPR